ncbi:MAG: PadR family transcriptional regulator [Acidobacteriota bacterium]
MMVLRTLSAGQTNGYEVAKAIERLSDDVFAVDHGSLYPALQRLEQAGLVAANWEISSANRRARYYKLSAARRKQLTTERDRWAQAAAAITRVMAAGKA